MPLLAYLGLLLALLGTPLLLAFSKSLHFEPFSVVPRLSLWVATAAVLLVAAENTAYWREDLGLKWPSWQGLGLAILATAILIVVLSVYYGSLRGKFRSATPEQLALQGSLFRLPLGHRCFVVATAAVTEEVLYRGYAIGVGQHLLGSAWLACAISVAVFQLAHFRQGLANMIPIFFCALTITLLFTFTQNLWVCIVVHAVLDGVAILVMPAIAARRKPASAIAKSLL